ncbi:MAG: MoaD/ThiS family protein [Promethearchaeota archaeon]|jgi:molybdopterin converting factor small subunit
MSILVKLYGGLKRKGLAEFNGTGIPDTIEIEINKGFKIFNLLKQFQIEETEVSHIFVNGVYCGLGKEIKRGDRVGIFPRRMGMMFVEITKAKSICAKLQFENRSEQIDPDVSNIEVPDGTTVAQLLNIYGNTKKKRDFKVLVNKKRIYMKNYTIQDGDIIEILPVKHSS